MSRWSIALCAALLMVGADIAVAQEGPPGPGVLEIHLIPGGATFFTETDTAPDFVDYAVGGAVTWNPSRIFGIEGEVGGNLGMEQSLSNFRGLIDDETTPNFLNYSGNLVASLPTGGSVVPYAVGGIGALTMFEKEELGVNDTATFLTGNVGGGLKWYANGRWGLRGDYRFMLVRDKDDAPTFFGGNGDTRYGHRVYGAIMLNLVR
jgi:Outer membrane protein beta-barrel domain